MGYSLSFEQVKKLEDLAAQGRRCAMATGRGGCFNRATVRELQLTWSYERDKVAFDQDPQTGPIPRLLTAVFCPRHSSIHYGGEGGNFRTIRREVF
jgi:hypothetical protein